MCLLLGGIIMETFKTSNGIEYQFVHGLEQAEEITDFR